MGDVICGDGAGAGAAAGAGAHSDYVGGAGGAGGTSSAGADAGAFAGVEGLVMVPDGLDGEGVSHGLPMLTPSFKFGGGCMCGWLSALETVAHLWC
jgi:hypothetical protein